MKKVLLILLLSFAKNASAYILPPSYYFQQWTEQTKSLNSFLIKQEREITGGLPQVLQETVKVKKQGLYRFAVNSAAQEEVKIMGATKAAEGRIDSLSIVSMQQVISPLDTILLYTQASRIESALKQLGVDVSKYSLELIQSKKEIMIGDEKGNRIYVSPDTQKMDAMVYQNKLYMFRYNPGTPLAVYPSIIEIYENNQVKEKITIRSIATNAKFSDLEFDVK
jgi:hypothetical protein